MYFAKNYEQSRQNFIQKVAWMQAKFPQSRYYSYLMPPGNKDGLYTDVLYIPVKDSDTLIVITSGVHGIEGFTGSALQKAIMNLFFVETVPLKTSLLFVHSVNPYGHKNFRRVNENNVDLNRNFLLNQDQFDTLSNTSYAKIEAFLNSKSRYQSKLLEKTRFVLSTLKVLKNYGIKSFRQAILQGQYQFEKGIFFGGKNYQAQKDLIDTLIEKHMLQYKKVILIDIHTGYGYRGKLHLIGMDTYPDETVYEDLQALYPDDRIEKADAGQGDFYKINGAMFDYIYHKLTPKNIRVLPVAWEFGTNDNIKTLKSIESLRIIRAENQAFHYGCKDDESSQKIKDAYRNLFYPDSDSWQRNILEKAKITFEKLLNQL